MSNGISIFHPRTETFLIFIFSRFFAMTDSGWVALYCEKNQFVAELSLGNACVQRNLAIRNYSTCRCHGDICLYISANISLYVYPWWFPQVDWFAKGANFWFIPILSFSGAPDYVDQLRVAVGLMPRTAQSPPKDGLVWFGNDLLVRTPSFGCRQDRTYYLS